MNFNDFSIDSGQMIDIYRTIKDNNISKLVVKNNIKSKEVILTKENLLEEINDSLEEFNNSDLSIVFFKQEAKNTGTVKKEISIPTFPLKKQLKYAFSTFKKHWLRNTAAIVSLGLSILLMFMTISVIFYDIPKAMIRSFEANDLDYVQLNTTFYHEERAEEYKVSSGEAFYNKNKDLGIKTLKGNKVILNEETVITLFTLDEEIIFNGVKIEVPNNNEIVATSFLKKVLNDKLTATLSYYSFRMDDETVHDIKYIKDSYDEDILEAYLESSSLLNGNDLMREKCNSKYLCAFVSEEFYQNRINQISSFSQMVPSLSPNLDDVHILNSRTVFYQLYKEQVISIGRAPENKNEILMSMGYFNDKIRTLYENPNSIKPEEFIGKKLYVKDYKTLPPSNFFYSNVNVYDLTPQFTIVGVSDDLFESLLYVNNDFMDQFEKPAYYQVNYYAKTNDHSLISNLYNNGYQFYTTGANFINSMQIGYQGDIIVALSILSIIFFVVAISLLYLSCSINVKEKSKEICVIKSMGIENKSVNRIFIFLNSFIIGLAFILGFAFAFGVIFGVNTFFQQSFGRINFDYFILSYYAVLIVIAVFLLSVFIITMYPLRVIKKMDISIALKSNSL